MDKVCFKCAMRRRWLDLVSFSTRYRRREESDGGGGPGGPAEPEERGVEKERGDRSDKAGDGVHDSAVEKTETRSGGCKAVVAKGIPFGWV